MRETIAHILRQRKKEPVPLNDLTPAAVLVPLFLQNGQYQILFTQRSMEVRDHKGQIAFPGGMWESCDNDLKATALRETEEELGIRPEGVEVLGELNELVTPTGYHITPFVGVIPHPYEYRLNRQEIAGIIEVPLEHLLEPQNLRLERGEFFNAQTEMPYFQYKQHVIWGATGRITRELVELILDFQRKRAS
ncbi:CoA pyrophosphatase [Deltaproteobacteria bacterium PRO3]|nr:CoA pyrophosphatase [Deltaproteobacteria bacterium PRO3]